VTTRTMLGAFGGYGWFHRLSPTRRDSSGLSRLFQSTTHSPRVGKLYMTPEILLHLISPLILTGFVGPISVSAGGGGYGDPPYYYENRYAQTLVSFCMVSIRKSTISGRAQAISRSGPVPTGRVRCTMRTLAQASIRRPACRKRGRRCSRLSRPASSGMST
jgi:hypothetical protein